MLFRSCASCKLTFRELKDNTLLLGNVAVVYEEQDCVVSADFWFILRKSIGGGLHHVDLKAIC